MKNPLRLATFRALAPDETSGGVPAIPEPATPDAHKPVDFDALAETAYDAVEHEHDEATAPEEGADTDSNDEGVRPDATGVAEGLAAVPADVAERYPIMGGLRGLDAALTNPATAAETLRGFVQAVANHHGVDFDVLLGRSSGASPRGEEDDATPGERRLSQRLDALQARIEPTIHAQRENLRNAYYEDLVRRAMPSAIGAVKAETGWTPTEAQVLKAARAYPQLAASSLSHAVQAAYVKEIVAAAREGAKGERPRLDDMPLGGPRSGTRAYEPSEDGSVDWNKLAEAAYEAVVAG